MVDHVKISCPLLAATLLFIMASAQWFINIIYFHYPGNNYFPTDSAMIFLILILMYSGAILQFGRQSKTASIFLEIIYFFLVICIIAYATNSVQLTPFPIIDPYIISVETVIGIHIDKVLVWVDQHLILKNILTYAYETLAIQMSVIPLIIIASRKITLIREYYFFLLMSSLLGFGIYYFFPTTAPASFIDSPLFLSVQKATGMKFNQIHHYIKPTTYAGGLIAFPSFHVIWAWFSTYLVRDFPLVLILLIPINILLVASCVLLGWHYPSDIVGGFMIIIFTHLLFIYCKKRSSQKARSQLIY